jgi:DNA-binding beta-propeller fold protein YncE
MTPVGAVVLAFVVAFLVVLSGTPTEGLRSPSATDPVLGSSAVGGSPSSGIGPLGTYVPPSVGQTTVVTNNTVYPGLFRSVDTLDSGMFDWGTLPAYDPSTNLFYEPVSNVTENSSGRPGGYLAAISPATGLLVQLVRVGVDPIGVTFDSTNGLLYVVNYGTDNISVVDPSTNSTIGTLGLPNHSYVDGSVAVNGSSGHLFLASPANGVIYDVNITADTNASFPAYQDATTRVVYDNQTGELYQVGTEVQVIGPNNDTVWDTITLPTSSIGAGVPAVDWETDELYVPMGNTTSAVNLATRTLGPTLYLSSSEGTAPAATFDPNNGMIYVLTDYANFNVTELDPATHKWVASSPPIPGVPYGGIAYSNVSGRLLLAGDVETGSSGFLLMSPTLAIVGQPLTATYPGQSYFDPSTGYLFVPMPGVGGTGNVTVINPNTGKVLGFVPAGVSPESVWVDPTTGFGYVANFGPPASGHVDNLTVFNARTFADTGSIPVGAEPYCMTYDPATGYLYISNDESTNITVLDPATNSSVGSISTPSFGATALLYVPSTTLLYAVGPVGGESYGVIELINPSEMEVVTSTDTYFQPSGATYDAATGLIYVQDTNSSEYVLQDFDPATGTIVGSINISQSSAHLAWDPVNDLVYVPAGINYTNGGFDANWVEEVNVTSGAIVNLTVGEEPAGISINPSSGEAFVSDVDSGSVVFIDPGTPAPSTGFTVTFETDPSTCSITFNGVTYTSGEEASSVAAGMYPLVANTCSGESFSSWASSAGALGSSSAASTTLTVSANGTVTATYSSSSPTVYTVTFDVIPSTCSVTFNSVRYTNGEQATGVTAGTYPLMANSCTGESFSSWASSAGAVTSPASASTMLTVSSSGTVTATYASTSPGYTVTFDVSPSTCSITFDGTTYSDSGQATGVAAGSYSLAANSCAGESFSTWASTAGAIASTTSASTMVTVSSNGTITATFVAAAPAMFIITFTESGLPSKTTWTVTLAGGLLSGASANLTATVVNGTYDYSVGTVGGYTANVTSGSVVVHGADKVVLIGFSGSSTPPPSGSSPSGISPVLLGSVIGLLILVLLIIFLFLVARARRNPLVFAESGLPGGTSWEVTVDGLRETSTASEIEFHVKDGIHAFQVGEVAGFSVRPSSGSVEVKKDRRIVPVTFGPDPPKS